MISARSTFVEFRKPIVGSYSAFITDENLFERVSSPMFQKDENGLFVHDTLRLKVSGAIGLEGSSSPDEVYVQVPVGRLEIHTQFASNCTTLYRGDVDNIPSHLTRGDLFLSGKEIYPHLYSKSRPEAFRYHKELVHRIQDEFSDHGPTIADILHFHNHGNRIVKVNHPSRVITEQETAQYFP